MDKNNNINNINKINKLYDNLTYSDNYGGSVILFIVLTVLLFIVVSYCYVKTHISSIKKNWITDRCKPYVIPFAGMINKPDNMTAEEYTEQNFTFCAQTILKDITSFALDPLTFIVAGIEAMATVILDDLQGIRGSFNNSRNSLANVVQNLMGQFMNLMTPLQLIIVKFSDLCSKIQGTMTSGLYTLIGGYMTFQVLLDVIARGIAIFLIIMIPLAIDPFTAIIFLPLYIALFIPFMILLLILEDALGVSIDWGLPPSPPAPPSCFDKNTMIKMNDGSEKKIEDIAVGDTLANNNTVTAKIKLSSFGSEMYNLNNIIVSGTHSVKIENKWVKIKDLNKIEKIKNYKEEYIYCLNAENKEIEISNLIFCDWDEIFEDDIETIKIIHKTNKYKTNNENKKEFENGYIHRFFDGGFIGSTKIKMFDGMEKEIKDVKINDILNNGEKVYGFVEINGKSVNNQCKYNLGKLNAQIVGGPNLNLCDRNIKFTTTIHLDEKEKLEMKENKLYHLLTDKKTFYVSNLRFYDYNATIELLLEKYRGKLLSMKYV